MKKFTLKLMLLSACILLTNASAFSQITYLLQEDFAGITGSNTNINQSTTAWAGNTNFPTVSAAFQAGDAVKLGDKNGAGSITSKTLDLSVNGGNFSISFDVKGAVLNESQVIVTVTGLTAQTVTYTKILTEGFENNVLNFTGGATNSTIKLETTGTGTPKRAYIDNIKVYYSTGTVAPIFSPAPGSYSTVQNVTLTSGNATDKIYYTVNGNYPDKNSTLYSGPIAVSSTTTIKAITYDQNNANPSTISEGTYTISPIVSIAETSVTPMFARIGANKTETITVSGINLTGDLGVNITGADAAFFSLSPAVISPVSGTVSNTSVTITYTPTAQGQHTATLRVVSAEATAVTRALYGVASFAVPHANDVSSITSNSFTAQWNTVSGATEYKLDVYTLGATAETPIFYENFDKFSLGTLASPSNLDVSSVLDGYTQFAGWSGTNINQAGQTVKVGTNKELNTITTPTMNLTGTNVKLTFKAMGWNGDQTSMEILLDGNLIASPAIISDQTTWTTIEVPITGGTSSSKITFSGASAIPTKARFFLNDVVITKDAPAKIAIAGSPFTATGNSYSVTGLSANTNYYYTVTATDGTTPSSVSNEVLASTVNTANALEPLSDKDNPVYVIDNKIMFKANKGEIITLHSVTGQRIFTAVAEDGLNTIPVNGLQGVVIVRVGNKAEKVKI